MWFKNTYDEPKRIDDDLINITDVKGNRYNAVKWSATDGLILDGARTFENELINPGIDVTGYVLCEVPSNINPKDVIVTVKNKSWFADTFVVVSGK
ncbi:hypothetical protein BED47_18475 [Gottfriedia luciferensis]|uniref:Uncharacterized protein n=1 Tax=Gottfriedia luciferensis TaxID=178774 RepID=A0ABX2ZSI6_9BACI|nr:hypothetical protein [Gottfriedia luciferensis]ODG92670.1 hypothetical protein BED47_18475 [Gottfriedia luciferensis]